jgi:CSLREA domain-containing protein
MVTTVADDNVPNDGSVSLREAIQAINNGTAGLDPDISNQNPGMFGINDTINFNISAAGTIQTINVGGTGNGALPVLLRPMTINGYSESGASMNTLANGDNAKILIELNGANAGPNADGLLIGATGAASTIEGLCVNRFSLNGIELQGGGDTIAGNFVGTNPQGNAAEANQNDGIHISNSNSSTVGGTTPGARNIASGNQIDGIHIVGSTAAPATGNLIQGNFVGINAAGTGSVGNRANGSFAGTPEGNGVVGIEISGGNANTVGGATNSRNVVGLNLDGIEIDNGGENNVVQGNFSGVGADGVTALGNLLHGIVLRSSDNLTPPIGPGQANEPAVSGNIVGLNPNTGFTGPSNLVEFNGSAGIAVFGNPLPNNATPIQNAGNSILGNSIFKNGQSNPSNLLGIDLSNEFVFPKDDGVTPNNSKGHGAANNPNNFQNAPFLTSVVTSASGVTITGTLDASASTTYRIEFFASPSVSGAIAEGQNFLGATNVTTGASGHASFKVSLAAMLGGQTIITATATNLTADPLAQAGAVNVFNTSEFSAPISTKRLIAAAADAGNLPEVRVFDSTNTQIADFFAFDPRFRGGVRVAVGDVNGDGVPDIIVAAGPGGGPHVKVIDGTKLGMIDGNGEIDDAAVIHQFYAYAPSFMGGVFVAFGRAPGALPEIVTGAGGQPHVKVIDATKLNQLQANAEIADSALVAQFYAYNPVFGGGVTVAAADLNGDGILDVVTGAGPGGGPHVKVIDGTKLHQLQANAEIADSALIGQFLAGTTFDHDGVFVAGASNNGNPIVVTSHATGSGPVEVIDATKLNMLDSNSQPTGSAVLGSFFAYNPHDLTMGTSAHVAALDFNTDGVADILIGPSQTMAPEPVEIVDGTKLNNVGLFQQILPSALLDSFFAFGNGFTGGVFVGGV